MTTPIIDENGECQFCKGFHNVSTSCCGKDIVDSDDTEEPWNCTRPKGHEGPCVACISGSLSHRHHNLSKAEVPNDF